MNLKPYIALFFAFVFLGKFLVMDSKVLVTLLESDRITFTNPFCENQQGKFQDHTHQEVLKKETRTFGFSLDSFCSAPFQFQIFQWEYRNIPVKSGLYVYHSPSFPSSDLDRFYPPPKQQDLL